MNVSTPTQPPTTANNTINAEGNFSSDAVNVSTLAQPPTTANNTINADGYLSIYLLML
jgi:hypothetical protein